MAAAPSPYGISGGGAGIAAVGGGACVWRRAKWHRVTQNGGGIKRIRRRKAAGAHRGIIASEKYRGAHGGCIAAWRSAKAWRRVAASGKQRRRRIIA
jgi:hypothetical protein